jgi:4-alpha-glucanotransferase/glycosidase
MDNLFFHDSRQKKYRSIFGAAPTGARVTLRLDVFWQEAKEVSLHLYEEGEVGKETVLPMKQDADEHSYTVEITTPDKGCLLWYYFIIKGDSTKYYGNNQQQQGGVGSTYDYQPPSFQITVYDKTSTTPDWFKNAVVYQIFPDRFYHSTYSDAQTTGKPNAVMHKDWYEQPGYIKDDKGCVLKYDFFGGNLTGIREKLSYLEELGVNVLYLNPVFESASNHRYDTGDYKKIDSYLGTNEDMKLLCQEAAEHGMRVVLDGVFSHTGDDSLYFNKYGRYPSLGAYQSKESPYYHWYRFEQYPDKYASWWGVGTLPEVEETTPDYMDFIFRDKDSVMKTWFKAGISGWRLDVADELPPLFLKSFWQELKKTKKDAILIGEVWEDASNKISYGVQRAYLCGGQLDSVMNYVMRNIMLSFVQEKADAGATNQRILNQMENYPLENYYAMLNLLGSHDVERVLTMVMDKGKEIAEKRLCLLWTWQMTMPGAPCIYYGDEAGVEGLKDPDNRRTYPWGRENKALLTACQKMVHLRRQYAALRTGRFIPLVANDSVYVYARAIEGGKDVFGKEAEDGLFFVALNSSDKEQTENIYTDSLAYGELTDLLEPEKKVITSGGNFRITIPAYGSRVLMAQPSHNPKRAGVLLHPTSLPSFRETGDITKDAFAFIDFLKAAGQTVWQVLPLTPTGVGDSPYLSASAFAINPALFANAQEKKSIFSKLSYLKFCHDEAYWLDDYALYEALKKYFKQEPWFKWPSGLKHREKSELEKYAKLLAQDITACKVSQYWAFKNWRTIKEYANKNGIRILGDVPIFVAHDSADCWARQEFFDLKEDGSPAKVAGVPPDYFSKKGQLWGNPLYAWDRIKKDNYNWWVQRFTTISQLVDEVRIDHFRGFAACWAVDATAEDAIDGQWLKGPGAELFKVIEKALPHLKLVAEDLGVITEDVLAVKDEMHLPGMRIMEFMVKDRGATGAAFDTEPHCLAYTGTHDNNTLLGWYKEELDEPGKQVVRTMLGLASAFTPEQFTEAVIEYLYSRRAETVIVPMQDILALPSSCRMNIPGTATGNWQWRLTGKQLEMAPKEFLKKLCTKYNR